MLCGMHINLRYGDPRTFCFSVYVLISTGNTTQIRKIREIYFNPSKVSK